MNTNYISPTEQQLLIIFNISPIQATNCKRRIHLAKIKHLEERIALHQTSLNSLSPNGQDFLLPFINGMTTALNKHKQNLAFLNQRNKEARAKAKCLSEGRIPPQPRYTTYDTDRIKEIPIRRLLERFGIAVTAHHKFQLRNEAHASCSINLRNNTWKDFGDGNGGDNIALYQHPKLGNCNFQQALKELNQLI